jgi:ornithine decarboxylase
VAVAGLWFQANFKGDVYYPVKANPRPWVIRTLSENGVTAFDVASIPEIELVAEHAPGSRMAFMHPVKSRAAISAPTRVRREDLRARLPGGARQDPRGTGGAAT